MIDTDAAGASIPLPSFFLKGRLDELGWIDWEGEQSASLFDPGTGQTHVVNAFPAEILRLVGNETRSLHAVAADLAQNCGVVCDGAWIGTVAKSARALCDLDLLAMLTGSADQQAEPPSP